MIISMWFFFKFWFTFCKNNKGSSFLAHDPWLTLTTVQSQVRFTSVNSVTVISVVTWWQRILLVCWFVNGNVNCQQTHIQHIYYTYNTIRCGIKTCKFWYYFSNREIEIVSFMYWSFFRLYKMQFSKEIYRNLWSLKIHINIRII